ncbi:hypothetical protein ACIQZB_42235 [Streptomyces sp. NPDC097727]|uniref:hypothetical protein n=1 Tax=Streptomyces sp. NPDC097727 TaxID=3366092 RepID=UPI0037F32E27
MSHASTVAVLGAGALGAAMAMRLGDTGHEVPLWKARRRGPVRWRSTLPGSRR